MKCYQLLKDKSKWCQNSYAKAGNNHRVDYLSDKAVKFCMVGAINRCYEGSSNRRRVMDKICQILPIQHNSDSESNILYYNDEKGRKFEDVKRLFKKANV